MISFFGRRKREKQENATLIEISPQVHADTFLLNPSTEGPWAQMISNSLKILATERVGL
jgi:hypothetical protein